MQFVTLAILFLSALTAVTADGLRGASDSEGLGTEQSRFPYLKYHFSSLCAHINSIHSHSLTTGGIAFYTHLQRKLFLSPSDVGTLGVGPVGPPEQAPGLPSDAPVGPVIPVGSPDLAAGGPAGGPG